MHKIKAYKCKIIEGDNRIEIDVYGKHYIYFYIDNSDEYPSIIIESDLLKQGPQELRCFGFGTKTAPKFEVKILYDLHSSHPVIFCNYRPICLITEDAVYTSKMHIKSNGNVLYLY